MTSDFWTGDTAARHHQLQRRQVVDAFLAAPATGRTTGDLDEVLARAQQRLACPGGRHAPGGEIFLGKDHGYVMDMSWKCHRHIDSDGSF